MWHKQELLPARRDWKKSGPDARLEAHPQGLETGQKGTHRRFLSVAKSRTTSTKLHQKNLL
jgi:hypothetical protein